MVNSKKIDPMLTTSDVARLLNIHINTVRRWSNQGVLKTYRIGSRGDRRFRQEDITSFLSQELKKAEVGGGENSLDKSPAGGVDNLLVDSKV
jgi:excisionase family DNA binding protein